MSCHEAVRNVGQEPGPKQIEEDRTMLWRKIERSLQFRTLCCFLILSLWAGLFFDPILWLGRTYTQRSNLLNLVLLTGIIFVLLWRTGTVRKIFVCKVSIHFNRGPVLLMVLIAGLFLLENKVLGIRHLEGFLFFGGLFVFLRFTMSASLWKRGIIPLLLIFLTFPLNTHLNTFVGFPLRLIIADVVQIFFNQCGFQSLASETIIIIENEVTQIDLPCSGVKGMWAGMFFFLSLTWFEKKRISIRWLSILLTFMVLIIFANVLRIGILITLHSILDKPEIARYGHVPSGILLFALPSFVIFIIFQRPWLRTMSFKSSRSNSKLTSQRSDLIRAFGLILFILICFLFASGRQEKAYPISELGIPLPDDYVSATKPLSRQEELFFARFDHTACSKQTFQGQFLSGELLVVESFSRRAHHNPLDCLQGNGYRFHQIKTVLLDDLFPIRYLTLNEEQVTAIYWFQSERFITEDLATRIWLDIFKKEVHWFLVVLVFDQKLEPSDHHLQDFLISIKTIIQHHYGREKQ
ncbi:exosortase O [candidate division CSSED10-310 bacterium]|uniref:Exosortase O n=1 Tax=candidate division CSSED10-310 bacterium TaxID=2855610 RepID=A0ABV6YTP4_UNCC1